MGKLKSLSDKTLEDSVLKADRKNCRNFGMCGVGDKAIYLPGAVFNRRTYVPLSEVTHVFKRVAYSNADGKGLLAPVLYVVVRYDDGKEKQCIFKDIREADKMLEEVNRVAPSVYTLSPAGVEKQRKKEELDEKMKAQKLSENAEKAIRELDRDETNLKKSPGLYENLSGIARIKRKMDLIKPAYQWIVLIILLAGIVGFVAAIIMRQQGMITSTASVITMLICAMIIILMINTKILPGPVKNKKNVTRDYEQALHDMDHFVKGFNDYHLPARYSHPVVIEMLRRIILEGRAETIDEALSVLKQDLKEADNTKVVSREVYEQIVTVKPMFTVADYK